MEFNYKNKYSLKVILTHRNPRLLPLEKKSNIYHNMKVHKNESRVIITVFIEHILSRNQHAAQLHIVFNMDSPKKQNHLDRSFHQVSSPSISSFDLFSSSLYPSKRIKVNVDSICASFPDHFVKK